MAYKRHHGEIQLCIFLLAFNNMRVRMFFPSKPLLFLPPSQFPVYLYICYRHANKSLIPTAHRRIFVTGGGLATIPFPAETCLDVQTK